MPITFTTLSGALLPIDLDGNFAEIEDYLVERVVGADVGSGIDEYSIRRWTNGRLVSAVVGERPLFDGGYFQKVAVKTDPVTPDVTRALTHGKGTENQAVVHGTMTGGFDLQMELLGFPGESFYYDVQEEGHDISALTLEYKDSFLRLFLPTIPDEGVHRRHPTDQCWSHWLTVPQGSKRIWVPDGAVAFITGQFSVYPGPGGTYWCRPQNALLNPEGYDPQTAGAQQLLPSMKIALVVDTNPELREGKEFPNTNPNIKDPKTGATAQWCSWKFVNSRSIRKTARTVQSIRGSVALAGGSWYNFSLKYRSSGTLGYVSSTDPTKFIPELWDNDSANYNVVDYNGPSNNPALPALYSIGDLFWENVNLQIQLFYGRESADSTSPADYDHNNMPDLEY